MGFGKTGLNFKSLSQMNRSLIQLLLFYQGVAEITLGKRIL